MFKLIAIDLDGTLLNGKHEVPETVKRTLAKAKSEGVKIVLCSGRPIVGMQRYIKELNLDEPGDYAIAYNGAFTQDTHRKEVLSQFTLENKDLTRLYNLSLELNAPMHFFDMESLYTPNRNISKYTVKESFLNGLPLYYRDIKDIPADLTIPKIMYIDEPVKLNKVIDALPDELYKQYTIVQATPFFLGFIHPHASKGNAVKSLAERLGIKREEVMAIGDNDNDLSMIKYAGCGVAMGNAIPEVKAAADFQTLTNLEYGVSHAIEKLVLDPIRL